mmetsp:Transcript_54317/g.124623  ORF Transcript_54317/g.124623 Transcript_54317/m.124623 type:complete len:596 (-) Transcript_54317:357-2144(-)
MPPTSPGRDPGVRRLRELKAAAEDAVREREQLLQMLEDSPVVPAKQVVLEAMRAENEQLQVELAKMQERAEAESQEDVEALIRLKKKLEYEKACAEYDQRKAQEKFDAVQKKLEIQHKKTRRRQPVPEPEETDVSEEAIVQLAHRARELRDERAKAVDFFRSLCDDSIPMLPEHQEGLEAIDRALHELVEADLSYADYNEEKRFLQAAIAQFREENARLLEELGDLERQHRRFKREKKSAVIPPLPPRHEIAGYVNAVVGRTAQAAEAIARDELSRVQKILRGLRMMEEASTDLDPGCPADCAACATYDFLEGDEGEETEQRDALRARWRLISNRALWHVLDQVEAMTTSNAPGTASNVARTHNLLKQLVLIVEGCLDATDRPPMVVTQSPSNEMSVLVLQNQKTLERCGGALDRFLQVDSQFEASADRLRQAIQGRKDAEARLNGIVANAAKIRRVAGEHRQTYRALVEEMQRQKIASRKGKEEVVRLHSALQTQSAHLHSVRVECDTGALELQQLKQKAAQLAHAEAKKAAALDGMQSQYQQELQEAQERYQRALKSKAALQHQARALQKQEEEEDVALAELEQRLEAIAGSS